MGNWNMTVNGLGAHGNKGYELDADKLFEKFVEDLKNAGHQIQYAAFTYGGRDTKEIDPNKF